MRLLQELKKNLKIVTSGTVSFENLKKVLAEASYMVTYRPMQPGPAKRESSFIWLNDIIMIRSKKSACLGEVFVNSSLNQDLFPSTYKYAERKSETSLWLLLLKNAKIWGH